MSRLFGFLGGDRGEQQAVLELLRTLDRNRTPVRVEIEHTLNRFTTVLTLKHNAVIFAKPTPVIRGLERSAMVRFPVPNDSGRELRLEVLTPHYNLADGTPVFLCRCPESFIGDRLRRRSERFNTSRYTNLLLTIPEQGWKFRVMDLSMTGCKVVPRTGNLKREFPLGQRFAGGSLRVGDQVQIGLEYTIPRSHQRNAVGLELAVGSADPRNAVKLQALVQSLDRNDRERIRAESEEALYDGRRPGSRVWTPHR